MSISVVRAALALKQDRVQRAVWRAAWAGECACLASASPSGHAMLDVELAGGWRSGGLIELVAGADVPTDLGLGVGLPAWRLLAPALTQLSQQCKPVVLIAPPGRLDALALQQAGLALPSVLVVSTGSGLDADSCVRKVADALWATEQALKAFSSDGDKGCAGAVLTWLPSAVPPGALRRLQLASLSSGALAFVARTAVVRHQPSPAPLRLLVAPASGQSLAVTVFKRRGPPMTAPLRLHLPVTTPAPQHQPESPITPTLQMPMHEDLADMLTRLRQGSAAAAAQAHVAALPTR